MATITIDRLTVVTAVSKPTTVVAVVGVQGPAGTSTIIASPDPGNGLVVKENGLYVATDLGTFN